MKQKVCVIGLGYIGLPTASLLATKGYDVIGTDINNNVIETINKGEVHIVEPELNAFVSIAVSSGKLKAYSSPQQADIFIICVPTPFHSNTKLPTPNLEHVISATKSISKFISPGNTVILESTSPVGTTELIKETLDACGVDADKIYIAYCPERVLPGKIMHELTENDRIIGGINEVSAKKVKEFYKTFVNGDILITDSRTAEMCKLVENSYRDVNIAFANELSMICYDAGINVSKLIKLANHHPRVNILQAGCGVGGHCIAVDPWFIVSMDEKNSNLIRTAREVNNLKTQWVVEKIKAIGYKFYTDNNKMPIIACMGLAFKPDIDDLRESPAMYITKTLKNEKFNIMPVEPNLENYSGFEIFDYEEALIKADIIVFLVKHKEFKDLNITDKIVLDFCNMDFDAESKTSLDIKKVVNKVSD